jgi:putative aldouronate transport system permease protein
MKVTLISNKINKGVNTTSKEILKDLKRNKQVYIMAIPIVAFYIVFHYLPMYGIVIAFKDFSPFKGIMGSPWAGLKYFKEFFESVNAGRVIKNTVILSGLEILWGFPAPIILALLLNELRNKFYKRIVQTISYLPHFISLVVICGIILDFTATDGAINDIVAMFGFQRTNFMMKPEFFRGIFVGSGIWQGVGWGSIIYLSAISGIDPTMYEAAVMDGAGRFRQLLHITLPSISSTIIVLFIMRIGHVMSIGWEKVILLYNPMVYDTADVISSYIYRRGLMESSYSLSAAVGLFNSLINFTLIIIANKISKTFSESSLW